MNLLELEDDRLAHPVDVIEHVAYARDWNFERTGDDEIAVAVDKPVPNGRRLM